MNLAQTTLYTYPSASGAFDWDSTIPAKVLLVIMHSKMHININYIKGQ